MYKLSNVSAMSENLYRLIDPYLGPTASLELFAVGY